MSEPVRPGLWQSGRQWLPLSVAGLLADQLSKALILARFRLHESVTVLPVLEIVRAHNTGAAFSFLAGAGGWQRWFFTVLAIGVSLAILFWLRQLGARTQAIPAAGLALVLGGALGNLADRLRHGYVVDFVHVHWGGHSFPAFNVADACITIGAGLLLLDTFLEWRRARAGVAP